LPRDFLLTLIAPPHIVKFSLPLDKPPAQPLVVWLDVGDQDPWRSLIERLNDAINEKGWTHEWHVFSGAHTSVYWHDHALEFYGFFQRAFAKTGGQSVLSLA